jgi:transcriptional regulator with PAS, ATPase and Fis domain
MEEAAAHIRSLLRISTLLQSTREMYAVRGTPAAGVFQQHLLALISDVVPSDEGTLFLYEDGGDRRPGLVDRVLEAKAPVFGETELAVPLFLREKVAGVIYLKRAAFFEDADFQMVTAISQIASLAIENAFHLEWLQSEVKRLEQDLNLESDLLGESVPMSELRRRIARVAPSDTTVLILGESGTGKELVARAVHRNSLRAPKPFVAISCAALTETLLESELFGHEKGAFTGAVGQKIGKLESAKGGTVFLDEVGEVPLQMQAKLLRVLQQREVERVGGMRSIPLDFRLIAATNRNLEEAVRKGTFRQDFFYRLNVVTLQTPSLRSRCEDILPLAQHFVARYGEKCKRKIAGISPEARTLLRSYEWPGNVRELENAIERAVVLGSSDMLLAEDLPEALSEARAPAAAGCGLLHDAVNGAKRAVVQRAFEQANNDHEEAARLLGVHPNYLYRLIKNMMLQPALKRAQR